MIESTFLIMAEYLQSEPDSNMMVYFPKSDRFDKDSQTLVFMKGGRVDDKSRKLDFEQRVKGWLKTYLTQNHKEDSVLICLAPGHKAGDNSSFMHALVQQFIAEHTDLGVEDGTDVLVRHKTVQKQTEAKSKRSETTHRESIKIKEGSVSKINHSKVVIILDDVWTTGCTLRVCGEKIRATGPKDVKLLAIGKTR